MDSKTKFSKLRLSIRQAHSTLANALDDIDVPRITISTRLSGLESHLRASLGKTASAETHLESALNHLRDYRDLLERERAQ